MRPALLLVPLLVLAACHKDGQDPHASLLRTLERAGESTGPPALKVESRTAEMTRFPCVRCHDRPLASMKQAKPATHWEVKLAHAPGVVTECKTCHTEGSMESLRLMNGKETSFDASYELCAQCHSAQAADWRGGAHGKRTSGWAAERRVLSCTGCHNPHQPRFAPRWPALAPASGEDAR